MVRTALRMLSIWMSCARPTASAAHAALRPLGFAATGANHAYLIFTYIVDARMADYIHTHPYIETA